MSDIIQRCKYYLLVVVLSFLFLLPLFKGFYVSHDGEAHVARFAAMYQAFTDHQFPPRWAGTINHRYGNPVLIFFYPLPDYLASVLHLIGFSFEQTFIVLVSICFIIAPITFYSWAKTFLRNEQAVVAALLYGLAPYHFLDLFVRGDTGELLAFIFIPLVFLAIDMIVIKKSSRAVFLGSIAYACFILSHNALALIFTPVFLIYTCIKIVRSYQWETCIRSGLLFLLGLGIASYFWIPALFEKKYTHATLFIGDTYKHNFPFVGSLFYSPWGFGTDVMKQGGLSPQIGIVSLVLAGIGICLWILKKKDVATVFWLLVLLCSIFITTNFSEFIWNNISLLQLFEFPWRFTSLTSFAAVMVGCTAVSFIHSKKLLMLICIVFLGLCVPFLHVKAYTSHPDAYYRNFSGTTYYYGEASSMWTAGDPSHYPKAPVQILSGEGNISHLTKKSQLHEFTATMKTSGTLVDNTTYFPGWRVYVDDVFTPIQFQDPSYRGLITFPVAKGTHAIRVVFKETYDRLLADAISGASIMISIFGIITTDLLPSMKNFLLHRTKRT